MSEQSPNSFVPEQFSTTLDSLIRDSDAKIQTTLCYDVLADPYAVTARLTDPNYPNDPGQSWIFGYEFLRDAVAETDTSKTSGLGNVRFSYDRHAGIHEPKQHMYMELVVDDDSATLTLPYGGLRTFICGAEPLFQKNAARQTRAALNSYLRELQDTTSED